MNTILLINENYIKENSTVYQNVDPKLLRSHIFETQNIDYKYLLPSDLYDDIFNQFNDYKEYIANGGTSGITSMIDERILNLVDESKPYLLYGTLYNSAFSLFAKQSNKGMVTQTSDGTSETISETMFFQQRNDWKKKSESYSALLVEWLYENVDIYPEMDEQNCDENGQDVYTCPLYLGDEI